MDGNGSGVITARLPSGMPIRVELAEPESSDGMTSVGLRDLNLDKAATSDDAAGAASDG